MLLDAYLYLFRIPYAFITSDRALNHPSDVYLLKYLAYLCLTFVNKKRLLTLEVFIEISYYLQLHIKEIGNLLACSIPRCQHFDDLYSFSYVQLVQGTSLPVWTCRIAWYMGSIIDA